MTVYAWAATLGKKLLELKVEEGILLARLYDGPGSPDDWYQVPEHVLVTGGDLRRFLVIR